MLGRAFFAREAEIVARELLGKVLVHCVRGRIYQARLVETEAYVGPHDLACHAAKGRTKRTEVMFGPAGHAYVYLVYGMYELLNIVTGHDGHAQAVLLRAAEPIGWTASLSGPGKLTRAMKITRADNGRDMTAGKLFVVDDQTRKPRIVATPRIGVDYAQHWKDAPLRFVDADSAAISRRLPKIKRSGATEECG